MKILLVVQENITALQYFRQDMPHAALSRTNPEITYGKLTSKSGSPDVMQMTEEDLSMFDIISYLRQISYDRDVVNTTIDSLHEKNKKIVFDIDDYWRLPQSHNYSHGYKKHSIPEAIEYTLPRVDWVTTTTDYLAEKIYKYNQNVTILPNAIDPAQKQFTKRKIDSPRIRFGWAGGVHHLPDIKIMDESLKKVHRNIPGIQLCLGGFNIASAEYLSIENVMTNGYRFLLDDPHYLDYLSLATPAMDHISFDKPYRRIWGRDINSYADIYNNYDVALAPLADNIFNRCKSELKLIEAGWMGKAVIASDIPPYSDVIEHGVDGFLVKPHRNNIDWFVFMKRYAEDPSLIKEHAEKLEKKIRQRFNIFTINEKRKQLYEKISEN